MTYEESPGTTGARERILARIRAAVAHAPEAPAVRRDYRTSHAPDDPSTLVDLLDRNLTEYRATVHRTTSAALPALVAARLHANGAGTVVVPDGVPPAWLADTEATLVRDTGPLTAAELDACSAVLTGCALTIAETGTIVLDAGPAQGRRALTLVPDLHLCVVRVPDQLVASVPQALTLLTPTKPLTWISGPSATSDIELDRVEGVHGPRTLEVLLLRG
ncbi:LUD domain-containing protein [Streptomyces sp. NPDC047315]|uniref:LutC/YkgG family protein n=1 Tax=Streptomyces sp. NPDC047315 TaxID=3155142 RepID=UPI0034114673